MSSLNFNKEVVRFTFQLKQEVLQEILANATESDDSPSECHKYVTEQLVKVKEELQFFEKRYKASTSRKQNKKSGVKSTPRPMSAYNKFIKKTLPEIAKEHSTMDNKARMAKASEIWKKLTVEEKEAYKDMVFPPKPEVSDTKEKV
jgi:hypothetical protein